jgi:preprotein translocase subunit SecA
LRVRKIDHNVLNAKQHQREAEIVTAAGLAGTVTIATNMAGRGTDIKLGPGVKGSGGLAIIGTERHESRRIDRQLRGRAGRQGDPGSSQFYVSLEDDLMRLFGSERISKIMDRIGIKEGEVIQHSMITKSITNAQKKVEENNFAMRKRLLEYDDVMNSQREVVYRRRRNALFGDRMRSDLDNMLWDVCSKIVAEYSDMGDHEGLQFAAIRALSVDPQISEAEMNKLSQEALTERLYDSAKAFYKRKTANLAAVTLQGLSGIKERDARIEMVEIPFTDGGRRIRIVVNLNQALATRGDEVPKMLERTIMLSVIDDKWKNHLREMDELRTSVQNAVFEQKDPLVVYKFEAYELFQQALAAVNEQVITMIFKADLDINRGEQQKIEETKVRRDDFSKVKASHDDLELQRREATKNLSTNAPSEQRPERPLTRAERRMQERKGPKR